MGTGPGRGQGRGEARRSYSFRGAQAFVLDFQRAYGGKVVLEDLLRICCVSCRRMPGNADSRARSYRYLAWTDERNSFVCLQGRQVGEL